MLIAAVNIFIFVFGVTCILAGIATAIYHSTWIRESTSSVIIVVFMADDLIDGIATLCFSGNTFYRTLIGIGSDEVNAMNPYLAAGLRFIIYSSSFAALHVANRAGMKQLEKEAGYAEAASIIQERFSNASGEK